MYQLCLPNTVVIALLEQLLIHAEKIFEILGSHSSEYEV
jgi:hypothetical protein